MHNSVALLAAALCSFAMSPPTQADIAPAPISGAVSLSATSPDSSDVTMLGETVKLQVSPVVCNVEAVFDLKNTGVGQNMEIGFPYYYPNELHDFKAWVDGAPVNVSDAQRQDKDLPSWDLMRWKLWKTKFLTGQKHLIKVTYSTNVRLESWPERAKKGEPEAPRTTLQGLPFPSIADCLWYNQSDAETIGNAASTTTVSYPLWTGRGWKGCIKHASVEVDARSMDGWTIRSAAPHGCLKKNLTCTWRLSNIEPTGDITIVFEHDVSINKRAQAYTTVALRHRADFDYCMSAARALLEIGREDAAIEVMEGSLAEWRPSNAKTEELSDGMIEPKYWGALRIAETLLSIYDKGHKSDKAKIAAIRAIEIMDAELALIQPQQRVSYGFFGTGARILSLCNKYAVKSKLAQLDVEQPLLMALQESEKSGKQGELLADSLDSLAQLYFWEGKYTDAETLYLRSLPIREKQFGKDSWNFANWLERLALVYKSSGRVDELMEVEKRRASIKAKQSHSGNTKPASSSTELP